MTVFSHPGFSHLRVSHLGPTHLSLTLLVTVTSTNDNTFFFLQKRFKKNKKTKGRKGRHRASLQMSGEQLSKCQGGPPAFLCFCLLNVEVLFCCMRRSAVSLGCSEPGWERWREGTAPTLRLWPGVRITFFFLSLNSECSLHPGFPFTLVPLPLRPPSSNVILMDQYLFIPKSLVTAAVSGRQTIGLENKQSRQS